VRGETRDALVLALVGRAEGLPGPERTALAAFWARFDAAAPRHVRAALTTATVVVGVLLPRAFGHRGGLASLGAVDAERVVQRAAGSALLRPLLEATSIVACFAYLSDPAVETQVRGSLEVEGP
jgi:hypothetical protein